MESEKVMEAVAEAVWRANFHPDDAPESYAHLRGEGIGHATTQAKAAIAAFIEAVREPTPGMIEAGLDSMHEHSCDTFFDGREIVPFWQAMLTALDALMQEGK